MRTNPNWPSLYNPSIELVVEFNSNPTPPGAHFVQGSSTIFRFMFYWTLIFCLPPAIMSGVWAFISFTSGSPGSTPNQDDVKRRMRGRRLAGTLALVFFPVYAFIYALVCSLVVGYGLAGFYKVGGLHMSTWVPFCWGMIIGILNLIGNFPFVVNLI